MFNSWFQTLRSKLLGGFSLILALSIGVNIFAIYMLEKVQDVAIEISEIWMPSIYTLSDINTKTSDFMNRQQQHIFSLSEVEMATNEGTMGELENLIEMYDQRYEKLLEVRRLVYDDEESYKNNKDLFLTYRDNYKRYQEVSKQILEYSHLYDKEKAQEMMRGHSFNIFEDCSQTLSLLIQDNLERGQKAADHSRELFSLSRILIFFGSLISFLSSAFIAVLIGKQLENQIGGEPAEIAQVAKKVSEGDLTMKFNMRRNMSPTSIYSSMYRMVDTLSEIAGITNNIARGDLSHTVEVRSENDLLAISINQMIDNFKNIINQAKVIAKGDYSLDIEQRGEKDELGGALQAMTLSLRHNKKETLEQNWIKDGINQLGQELSGNLSLQQICQKATSFLARYSGSSQGALYIYQPEKQILKLIGTFAFTERNALSNEYKIGEGIIGQVALEMQPILLKNIRRVDMSISSGLVDEPPLSTLVIPLMFESNLYGVLELASFEMFDGLRREFFETASRNVATYIYSALQTERIKGLLAISEKATLNAEARAKEIEEVNAQLEEQRKQLEIQSDELQKRNESLIMAKEELDRRAEELELSNKYKSEFLANMSHELRTPLNSIIMLSKMLSKNEKKNLNEKDVKKSKIINKSGEELLRLINDILDLSKIEAGKMTIHTTNFSSSELTTDMNDLFLGISMDKQVEFKVDDTYQGYLYTDKERLYQIARNFLSNAFKFTKSGSVTLKVTPVEEDPSYVRISVVDTGIGIPEDKQEVIFEAFKQADGTTSREYGGTGLGLSIVKELSKLLQGRIELESQVNKGSAFTLIIPCRIDETLIDSEGIPMAIKKSNRFIGQSDNSVTIRKSNDQTVSSELEYHTLKKNASSNLPIFDDRNRLTKNDRIILIVEDDIQFAESLAEVIQSEGFKCLIAASGAEGLKTAALYQPDGIILDLGLPDMDGETLLDRFKSTPEIRHIPIEIVSARDKDHSLISKGAIGFLQKPIEEIALKKVIANIRRLSEKTIKDLLIVEDDPLQLSAIRELLVGNDVQLKGVRTQFDAIEELRKGIYDGVIVDLTLKEGNGYEICTFINEHFPNTPIIVYTARMLTPEEEKKLKKAAQSIVLKTKDAEGKLKEDVSLFLHRMTSQVDKEGIRDERLSEDTQVNTDVTESLEVKDKEETTRSESEELASRLMYDLVQNDLDSDQIDKDIEDHFQVETSESRRFIEQVNERDAAQIIRNKKILVVDDDIRNIFVIASALENFGAIILEAMSGEQALEMLKEEKVDMIMMDSKMPEMDGNEAIRQIRKNPNIRHLPIIAITGKAQHTDRQESLDAGANDYIIKPVDYDQLLAAVCHWMGKKV